MIPMIKKIFTVIMFLSILTSTDNSIVIGNPGKIIQRNSSPTKKYIVYPINYDKDS